MRIAYVLSHYPRSSQVFVQREVAGLRERGVEVLPISVRRPHDILTDADRREAALAEWLSPPRPWRYLRAHLSALRHPGAWAATLMGAIRDAPPGGRRAQVGYWGGAIVVWDLLRRRGIHHMHAHFATNASDVAMLAARMGRAAGRGPAHFTWHVHGSTDFFDVRMHRLALKGQEAAGIVCISDFGRAQALAWMAPEAAAKTVVVRYGVPLPPDPVPVREDAGALRLLAVGRLIPVKGHGVLLEALGVLHAEGLAVELDVVGDGPLREDLARLAAERGLGDVVRWHGTEGSDRVAERYLAADAFVLPSFAEGLPVVLLEAMAAGLPVVATAITGVPEVVTDGENGLLVRPARADLLADALRRLVADPALRSRLGTAARTTIAERFTLEGSADALHAALRSMAPAR